MAQHNHLGKEGETLAIKHLLANGYTILEKNYRYLKAEVDIIAQKNNCLIAIEVKTRSSNYYQNPQDAIHSKKIQLLIMAINNYIEKNALDVEVRFDVIAIIKTATSTSIEHIENAFLHF